MNWDQFKAKKTLEELIRGKPVDQTLVASHVPGKTKVAELKFHIPMNEFTRQKPKWTGELVFEVHADTTTESISHFIQSATDANICVALGDKKAPRLGIDGQIIDKLYVYLRTKDR